MPLSRAGRRSRRSSAAEPSTPREDLGRCRDGGAVYGSGGFCHYPLERLREQLGGWGEQGIPRVELQVSRHPDDDPGRRARAEA